MPFAAVGAAVGASAAAAASVGVAVTGLALSAGNMIYQDLSAPGGGGGGGGAGGSGGGGGGLSVLQTQYAVNGPAPGKPPTIGGSEKVNNATMMTPPKASAAPGSGMATNPRAAPTQAVGEDQAKGDYKDVWADRLSRYLDYNTRSLG